MLLGKFIAAIRLLLFVILTTITVLLIFLSGVFGKYSLRVALQIRRAWARTMMFILGIKLTVVGKPEATTYLLVSNHRSYLDPIVVLSHAKVFPVAKAEVRKWPLIGYGAKLSGIVYVKRESNQSRKNALDAIREAFKKGHSVLVYPEGTTTAVINSTIPFRSGAFRVAVSEGIPMIPCAIEYGDSKDYWIGDATFIDHFIDCFSKWRTIVDIDYGPSLTGDDAFALVYEAQMWINEELGVIEYRRELGGK